MVVTCLVITKRDRSIYEEEVERYVIRFNARYEYSNVPTNASFHVFSTPEWVERASV
jgi:hypothetical protein